MEPNVDRGMWSVVALLAAIVIGGVVLLAFPRISGKIANSMDDTVNKAFDGETPGWVKDNKENITEIEFLKEMKLLDYQVLNELSLDWHYNHNKNPIVEYKSHYVEEWGVNDATYVKFDVSTKKEERSEHVLFVDNRTNKHADRSDEVAVVGLIKNTGDSAIKIKNHTANKTAIVKPGETKFINLFGPYAEGTNPNSTKYYQVNFSNVDENKITELTYYGMFLVKGKDNIETYKSKLAEYGLN